MNITDLHTRNPSARERLMARVPAAPADFDRVAMLAGLPDFLEAALDLILADIDALPGMTDSSAVGCRILAACIDRLRL